jgi:hypothetical protein
LPCCIFKNYDYKLKNINHKEIKFILNVTLNINRRKILTYAAIPTYLAVFDKYNTVFHLSSLPVE